MMNFRLTICILLAGLATSSYTVAGSDLPITSIWLTHRTNDPSRIVVSWLSDQPGDATVQFGLNGQYGQTVHVNENTTLHHVEIPLTEHDTVYSYKVSTGGQTSAPGKFKAYPTDFLRVAVVADWQDWEGRRDLAAVVADDPHILMTAGDNINNIYPNPPDSITPYTNLINTYPEMFCSTPFMPVLGNHDKQIQQFDGGPAPADPVYDVSAQAFRKFFALPDDEWKWRFDVPSFNARFVALDLQHISDRGTTLQTCHDFDKKSEQYLWYKDLMANTGGRFVVTLYNESNRGMRSQIGGEWGKMFQKGTVCVTGFGGFAERAEVNGFPYYNTSLRGHGILYPDPLKEFIASENNYLLITFDNAAHTMTVEIKNLAGKVLDRKVLARPQ
jgi:hypothetical protein